MISYSVFFIKGICMSSIRSVLVPIHPFSAESFQSFQEHRLRRFHVNSSFWCWCKLDTNTTHHNNLWGMGVHWILIGWQWLWLFMETLIKWSTVGAVIAQWYCAGLQINTLSDQSCTRGMFHNKIHLISPKLSLTYYSLTSAEPWPKTPFILFPPLACNDLT